jgi:hypothetical protein
MPSNDLNLNRYNGNFRTVRLPRFWTRNAPREVFREKIETIPYLGYEVEQVSASLSVCICLPADDIELNWYSVWLYNHQRSSCVRITANNVNHFLSRLTRQAASPSPDITDLLEDVHNGKEPDDFLRLLTGTPDDVIGEREVCAFKLEKWLRWQDVAKYAGSFPGEFLTVPLTIRNRPKEEFLSEIRRIPWLAFAVERLANGDSICVSKPGAKLSQTYHTYHDIRVWAYDPKRHDWFMPSYDVLANDLKDKRAANPSGASWIFAGLRAVFDGAEPDDVLPEAPLDALSLPGWSAEWMFKVLKWMWGQEDCNYSTGDGRWRSRKTKLKIMDEDM